MTDGQQSDEPKRPHPIDVHFGARVAAYRRVAGLSQEALGDAVGVTLQQVQKYEKGTNRIGASRFFTIARTLDVPISVFFADLGEPVDPPVEGGTDLVRQGIALSRAFVSVDDPVIRQHLLDLVRRLSGYAGADDRAG